MEHQEQIFEIYRIAQEVRTVILEHASENTLKQKWKITDEMTLLMGQCIKASDMLEEKLRKLGYGCKPCQCWCLYENYESCTSECYEEHWLLSVNVGTNPIFVDTTS